MFVAPWRLTGVIMNGIDGARVGGASEEAVMHRLVYFSNANLDLSRSALEWMVEKSAARNRPLQISGALFYNGLNFLQILEGPRQALTPLYLQIRKDPRHSGVVKLVHERISTRSYPDWGMKLFCGAPRCADSGSSR